ncbi:MAG: NAD(P)-binding protein [Pseudonocardiaceae bacterium]
MTRTANGTTANRRRYHVIVVGAGIAGSLVAKQLGRQGWQVLVLEAGTGGRETWACACTPTISPRDAVRLRPRLADRLRRPGAVLCRRRAGDRCGGRRRGAAGAGHPVGPALRLPDAQDPAELYRRGLP